MSKDHLRGGAVRVCMAGLGKVSQGSDRGQHWGPTQPSTQWVQGVMRSGPEADHSPPSSVKIRGTIPPFPNTFSWYGAYIKQWIRLHGMVQ
jgi:hypothetical protein